jgi:putative transcriptional regulator
MKDENITRVRVDNPENIPKGKTDWAKVDAMTEEEVHAAARADPDAQPVTEEELKGFKRVVDVQDIRKRLDLSQREFAKTYHLSVRTLQEWEQRRIRPDTTATAFLTAIANDPDGVKRALEKR